MSADYELMQALFDRGIIVSDGVFERNPAFQGETPPTDDLLRYLNASLGRTGQVEISTRLKRQWIDQLAEVVRVLGEQGEAAPWPYMAIFWIRLHAVVVEMRADLRQLFEAANVNPATFVPNPGSLLAFGFEKLARLDAIPAAFTDDELVYLDYRRHTEAHPTQRAYDLRWSRRGLVDRRTVPTTAREYTVSDADDAIRRVLADHEGEPAIAVDFARRIALPLDTLLITMQAAGE